MTGVHLVGAQFCFVVYLVCEADALIDKENVAEMTQTERQIRAVLVAVGAVSMASFGGIYLILLAFGGDPENPYVAHPFSGMSDLYAMHTELQKRYLIRPAEGPWQTLKILSYVSEFLVAYCILISHLVIWYYYKDHIDNELVDESHHAEDDDNGVDLYLQS
eukprot:gnl/MRDRNA2_/MRDRNA2_270128_c0_seq1.p1 gnl/MRDRNA2_/MRDRNA2_270128_c0~~gnl/MRDRNA2_/MRDRNA2_270128_c0_seq1.p1  ORF type:complete len:175 (+),score=34.89 gnl/MRDRNA2_/MRDRNA2_270128_c0_seq1:41-526(+)